MTDALLQDLLDFVRGRYFGKYRGVVVEVDAPTMRIKASVPSVLGGVTSGWAAPCVPYAGPQVGFMMLPDVDSGVWIEFEGGDPSFPVWTGCYWNAGDIPDVDADAVKTIITGAGSLAFDNDDNSVTLQDSAEHSFVLDSSGATTTADEGSVAVSSSGVSVNNGALEVTPTGSA
jgi:uncharacterized protein involved in type VI secretion and phage assembly